jgi:tetratricopeptide (TPR) repeat protein
MPSTTPKDRVPDALESIPPEIFPLEEETQLLSETHAEKTSANKTFSSGDYSTAVQGYEKALATCPNYLEYDIAVLRSNIAACHIKLSEWKEAVDLATLALEALDRVDPPRIATKDGEEGNGHINEIDDAVEVRLEALTRTGNTLNDVHKMRTKALLRRAKARREVGGWSSLQGSLEDYQALSKPPNVLTGLDRETVNKALREIPIKLDEAKDREMKEMMGKLKQLGNGLLKPFGLSTDSFKFEKDEKSGGYSMGMNSGG